MREKGVVWGFRGLKLFMCWLAGRSLDAMGVCATCSSMQHFQSKACIEYPVEECRSVYCGTDISVC